PEALRAYCNQKCGVILGHGIGELSGKAFRVAHMGHVNAPMILGTLSVIEMALNALDIPHGKGGAQAAIDWLGSQVKAGPTPEPIASARNPDLPSRLVSMKDQPDSHASKTCTARRFRPSCCSWL